MLFIPSAILTATKRHPRPSPRKIINTTVQKVLRSQDVPTSAVSLNRLSRSQPFILHSAQLLVQCSDSVVPYTNNHSPFPARRKDGASHIRISPQNSDAQLRNDRPIQAPEIAPYPVWEQNRLFRVGVCWVHLDAGVQALGHRRERHHGCNWILE